jgi:hypothetical protein
MTKKMAASTNDGVISENEGDEIVMKMSGVKGRHDNQYGNINRGAQHRS